VAITYDQTTVERLWGGPNGTYSRAFWQLFKPSQEASPKWWRELYEQRIVPAIGTVTGAQRILYVGCGLGLGVEVVIDSGFVGGNAWGIDNSAYFQSLWSNTAQTRADIRPKLGAHDIRTVTNTQLRTLTGLGGNVRFTIIITEDILSSYTTAELQNANASVNPLVACLLWLASGGKIIHLMWTMNGSTPDMTVWPSGRQIPQADGSAIPETWAGQPMANPGSPPRTLAEWQTLVAARGTCVSMEGI
jgi:hypothetical protein